MSTQKISKKRQCVPHLRSSSKSFETIPWHYSIPLYCMFISLLLFATRDLDAAQASPINLSNVHRIICIPISIMYTTFFFLTYKKIRKLNLVLGLHLVYLLIGILSTYLFSEWFYYSIWKILEMLAVVMTGLYAWTLDLHYPGILVDFYKKTIAFFKFLLLSVLASLVLLPDTSITLASSVSNAFLPYRISGQLIKINAISIGTIASFIIYIASVKYLNNRKNMQIIDYMWLIISIILVIFAQSRTAIAGLILALILLVFLTQKTTLLMKICLYTSGITASYFFSTTILSYLQRGQSAQQLYSLTGRWAWWEFSYNKMLHSDFLHKVFGYGFGIGDRIMAKISSNNFMDTLDSTYMSSLASTGFLGTAVLILLVLYTNIKLMKKTKYNRLYLELFGISLILTVKSITSATVNIFTLYTFLFVILTVLANSNTTKLKKMR